MDLPDRHTLLGMTLGAFFGVILATVGPGIVVDAIADEFAAPAFDASQIVKFEGRDYHVENEDWVSTDPLSTTRIKKVEAGHVSYVTITTTTTGTYSTDALFSRHVIYPGVTVNDVSEEPANGFEFWSEGEWHPLRTRIGHSFSYYGADWQ